MNTKKAYKLEIFDEGVIQLLIQTIYLKEDGTELTRENWRTVLTPGDFVRAEELLDDYHLNIVKATWTNEVISDYERLAKEVV